MFLPAADSDVVSISIFRYSTLTFMLTSQYDNDTIHIAHCYPYTYTDLQRYLKVRGMHDVAEAQASCSTAPTLQTHCTTP